MSNFGSSHATIWAKVVLVLAGLLVIVSTGRNLPTARIRSHDEAALGTIVVGLTEHDAFRALVPGPESAIDAADGCRVVILATVCPAVFGALDDLEGFASLDVRGQTLPVVWVAPRRAETSLELLEERRPESAFSVRDDIWDILAPRFVPQAIVVAPDGSIVARAWPAPEFLVDLPDAFQYDFEKLCMPPAAR